MILPSAGTATRRFPSGVHASIRAPGTRAQTRAVQPAGTDSVCAVDSAPPPSPAGTTRGVLDRPAGAWTAGATADADDAGAGDEGAAAPGPCAWPADPEHATAAAVTAAATSAVVKPRQGTVMGSPSRAAADSGACTRRGSSSRRHWPMVWRSPGRVLLSRRLCVGHDLPVTPSSIRPFDAGALYLALNVRRTELGLSWKGVADQIWSCRPTSTTGAGTTRSARPRSPAWRNPRTSCQHALFMLRWLGRTPESFLQGRERGRPALCAPPGRAGPPSAVGAEAAVRVNG